MENEIHLTNISVTLGQVHIKIDEQTNVERVQETIAKYR